MATRSMTGYGRAERHEGGWHLVAEVRSVNHRGLDVRIALPPLLAALELPLRDQVKAACARGRVECRLSASGAAAAGVGPVALERAHQLRDALEAVRQHLNLPERVVLRDLLAAGLTISDAESEPPEGLESAAAEVVAAALEELVAARRREGAALETDLLARLTRVLDLVEEIAELARDVSRAYREQVGQRLEEILAPARAGGLLDEERLRQELVATLDRSDVTEEVVRARTHAESLIALLREEADEGSARPVGRRIDFFLQELGREANTVASKSLSAELTARVVEIKDEVERMREQANNIE